MPLAARHQDQISRIKWAAEATTLRECARHGFAIWIMCAWCGKTQITDAQQLRHLVKEPENALEELQRRLACGRCDRKGVRLIPTDRPIVSMEHMGAQTRES